MRPPPYVVLPLTLLVAACSPTIYAVGYVVLAGGSGSSAVAAPARGAAGGEDLKPQVAALESRVTELEQRVGSLDGQVAGLQLEVSALRALESRVAALEGGSGGEQRRTQTRHHRGLVSTVPSAELPELTFRGLTPGRYYRISTQVRWRSTETARFEWRCGLAQVVGQVEKLASAEEQSFAAAYVFEAQDATLKLYAEQPGVRGNLTIVGQLASRAGTFATLEELPAHLTTDAF